MGYIGLDVGGTNVRYAFTDKLNLKALNYHKKPFIKVDNPYTAVEENICNIIDMAPGDTEGISLSLAAMMDRNTGKVKTWPNNPCWNHYELVRHLNDRYKVPIVIEDDANCGAIGEYDSLSPPVKNMAYITIGTGIGCGLILNGSLFIGENGFAGELGHVWIDKDETKSVCSCGNKGCFQSMASGPAVLKEYNMAANMSLESLEQVYEQYIRNDPSAVKCLSNMINNISKVIYNLAICLDISIFIIGGGVSNMGAEFISNIENKVNGRLKPFEREISIGQARLGEFSGVYGALQLLEKQIV
jgi:glucokinase